MPSWRSTTGYHWNTFLRVAGLEAEAPQPGRQVSDADIQRAYDFVLGDPNVAQYRTPDEPASLGMKRFVVQIYQHFTGRRLL